MRTVFSNDEIPHLWANQAQEFARNGGESLSFRGETLYSYRQPVAKWVTSPVSGVRGVLFHSETLSVTTSRHQHRARMSVRGGVPTFNVDSLDTYRVADPASFLAGYRERLHTLAGKVKRARSNKSWYQDSLMTLRGEAIRFAEFFGLEFSIPESLDSILADAAALEAERAEARRVREEKLREAAEQERLDDAEQFNQWLAGESVSCPSSYSRGYSDHGYTHYLRVRQGSTDVETSIGAVVPLDHVTRVLPVVLRWLNSGRTYTRSTHTLHLGHYTLDSIDERGDVRVGCHIFSKAEVERFALTLGIAADVALA